MSFGQMQRQHVPLHESLRTVRTRIRLRALMRAYRVLEKRIALRVTLIALRAFEGLLSRVQPDVAVQVGLLNESLFAVRTPVRTFARVGLFVTHEGGLAHERLLTDGTLPQVHPGAVSAFFAAPSSGAALLQQRRRIETDLRANRGRLLLMLRRVRRILLGVGG